MSQRDQQELFPGYNEKRAAAERQAREWQPPLEEWAAPRPTWVDERGRGVDAVERTNDLGKVVSLDPAEWPAMPECSVACPWRKPQRVILAEVVLADDNTRPWPERDECRYPIKRHREIEDHDVCWPALGRLRLEGLSV